ncbi:hypothetical protein DRJ22_04340 [Candidatus Woesearchaeota archaeon]|nr:MAG: hypothetical protein DRJ22_04340 [Candidatus Woesearchaeota archaeon]
MEINLCQYKNLSCFGCCGYDFGNEKEFTKRLKENTKQFYSLSLKEFRERSEKSTPKGGCKALIIKNNKIICALHPLQNKGKDLRDKNCKKEYMCETFKRFKEWNKEKQKKFLKFIEEKKLSNYDYSKGMDEGTFLKEFES